MYPERKYTVAVLLYWWEIFTSMSEILVFAQFWEISAFSGSTTIISLKGQTLQVPAKCLLTDMVGCM